MPAPVNILILEDNPLDTEMLLRELQRSGIEPHWLRVDREADYLKGLHAGIDLILSDYQMPQFSGMRALELLKERGFDIPFILISGTIGEDIAVQAMRQGATDYLLKDRLTRLGPAVQHALEESRLRKERRAATETLRLQETALNAVSQGVLITDENRRIIYSNASFTRLTGYSQEEILGRNCSFLQGPDSNQETIQAMRVALNAGKPFDGEILNYRKGGQPFWNELSIAPLRSEHGGTLRFIGIQRDVTERKAAEASLSESELRYHSLFENMLEAYCFCRLIYKDGKASDFLYLDVNRAFETQIRLKNVVGRPVSEVVPGLHEANPELLEIFDRVASTGCAEKFETYVKPLGAWLSLSVYSHQKHHFVVVFDNITDRKQAGEKDRLTAERLQLATKAGGIGIWEFDCLSGKLTWNEQMFALYGHSRDGSDNVSERWTDSIHPEDSARAQAALAEALHDENKPFDTEFRIIRRNDGATRFIRAIASLLRDESGNAWRMIGTNWDVTEEREREQALALALSQEKVLAEQARAGDRAKGEFLAVMSHEIRTPLNGILGFSELLSRTPNLPAESREHVQTITSSGEALLRILNDVLDYSRLDAGQVQIEKTRFSPREIVADIHALLSQQAKNKHLLFEVAVEECIPKTLAGDAGRLRQILLNLTGNAIKFTEHGSVILGLRPMAGSTNYEFFVKDTGCGIAPAQVERLFKPFTQADSSISRRHGGSGLGLSISRRLAELMGGTLSVRSELGRGSEFSVVLPLEECRSPKKTSSTENSLDTTFSSRHPLHILVVEDDAVNLKLMLLLTRRLGYHPLSARNGIEAVEVFAREHPDCVLMDLQMPEMDGIEATEAIRAKERIDPGTMPAFISALTANIVHADRQRCFDAGMNAHLSKPLKLANLAELLERAADFHAAAVQPGSSVARSKNRARHSTRVKQSNPRAHQTHAINVGPNS